MPIYEYICKKCSTTFEKRQGVSDEPMKTCERCDGEVEKKWSLSGFQFKGEGWYVTDYANKKAGGSEKSESGEKSSTGESTAGSDSASKDKIEKPAVAVGESSTKKEK